MNGLVAPVAAPVGRDEWLLHPDHGPVRVIERQDRWGHVMLRLWSPSKELAFTSDGTELRPLGDTGPSMDEIVHCAAAARVVDALADETLLAPVRSSVTPLPHQLHALERALSSKRVRYLFADEVGLGKTIEAGLVIRELKLRGRAKRILIVAPKGLTPQWQAEMQLHFGERFAIADPSGFDAVANWTDDGNVWRSADQVICPLDSVKPLARRRSWSWKRIAEYNQRRFEDLVTAGWDLVVIDEAHRLGGSTDRVARYRLGAALADASPHLLLLSATPHSGKSEQFLRLMQLLDAEAFPDEGSLTQDRVAPFVVRTEKRIAIDHEGAPLFKPRQTRLESIGWSERHEAQRILYEAVTEYVRHGYNQSLKNKQRHIGFLMVLMQRLVTSSTAAITTTLNRRLAALEQPVAQLAFPDFEADEITDLDGQAQVDELIDWPGWLSEKAEVETLIRLADAARAVPDAKVDALLERIYQLQREEQDPDLKVLIFTEFVPTQEMLARELGDRGFAVATLNGGMSIDERVAAQAAFAGDARVLVSTDAGGEGLNLQFAHVMFNFDMPWNPMRIEQRIGRVDRIGQRHVVRATNFVLADTVEHRVRDVLEAKLQAIAEDFGVDKAADVMDSVEAEAMFDGVYLAGLQDPDAVVSAADETLEQLRLKIAAQQAGKDVLGGADHLQVDAVQRWRRHPVHHWIERAVISGVNAGGGATRRVGDGWRIDWPDGSQTITSGDAGISGDGTGQFSLEDARVRSMVEDSATQSRLDRVPVVLLHGLPSGILGTWSLWRVRLDTPRERLTRYVPMFVRDGRAFTPTAKRVWDELAGTESPGTTGDETPWDAAGMERLAVVQAEPVFATMRDRHLEDVASETERVTTSFAARRRAVERIGLEKVRRHRLLALEAEHRSRLGQLRDARRIMPALDLVVAVGIAT